MWKRRVALTVMGSRGMKAHMPMGLQRLQDMEVREIGREGGLTSIHGKPKPTHIINYCGPKLKIRGELSTHLEIPVREKILKVNMSPLQRQALTNIPNKKSASWGGKRMNALFYKLQKNRKDYNNKYNMTGGPKNLVEGLKPPTSVRLKVNINSGSRARERYVETKVKALCDRMTLSAPRERRIEAVRPSHHFLVPRGDPSPLFTLKTNRMREERRGLMTPKKDLMRKIIFEQLQVKRGLNKKHNIFQNLKVVRKAGGHMSTDEEFDQKLPMGRPKEQSVKYDQLYNLQDADRSSPVLNTEQKSDAAFEKIEMTREGPKRQVSPYNLNPTINPLSISSNQPKEKVHPFPWIETLKQKSQIVPVKKEPEVYVKKEKSPLERIPILKNQIKPITFVNIAKGKQNNEINKPKPERRASNGRCLFSDLQKKSKEAEHLPKTISPFKRFNLVQRNIRNAPSSTNRQYTDDKNDLENKENNSFRKLISPRKDIWNQSTLFSVEGKIKTDENSQRSGAANWSGLQRPKGEVSTVRHPLLGGSRQTETLNEELPNIEPPTKQLSPLKRIEMQNDEQNRLAVKIKSERKSLPSQGQSEPNKSHLEKKLVVTEDNMNQTDLPSGVYKSSEGSSTEKQSHDAVQTSKESQNFVNRRPHEWVSSENGQEIGMERQQIPRFSSAQPKWNVPEQWPTTPQAKQETDTDKPRPELRNWGAGPAVVESDEVQSENKPASRDDLRYLGLHKEYRNQYRTHDVQLSSHEHKDRSPPIMDPTGRQGDSTSTRAKLNFDTQDSMPRERASMSENPAKIESEERTKHKYMGQYNSQSNFKNIVAAEEHKNMDYYSHTQIPMIQPQSDSRSASEATQFPREEHRVEETETVERVVLTQERENLLPFERLTSPRQGYRHQPTLFNIEAHRKELEDRFVMANMDSETAQERPTNKKDYSETQFPSPMGHQTHFEDTRKISERAAASKTVEVTEGRALFEKLQNTSKVAVEWKQPPMIAEDEESRRTNRQFAEDGGENPLDTRMLNRPETSPQMSEVRVPENKAEWPVDLYSKRSFYSPKPVAPPPPPNPHRERFIRAPRLVARTSHQPRLDRDLSSDIDPSRRKGPSAYGLAFRYPGFVS